jgi:DNA-binding transcriptional MerR regulator
VEHSILRSGELARLAGISTDLLRHYERMGVLDAPLRAANGYRSYAPDALERVRAVRRALSIGFSLSELARIFALRKCGGIPCREVRALAEEKLKHVDERLTELKVLRDHLRKLLCDWDGRLAAAPPGRRAELLHSLPGISFPGKPEQQITKKGFSRR